MKPTNAALLLDILSLLTMVAACTDDREDAEDTAACWWLASTGASAYLPDGRVLVHLS